MRWDVVCPSCGGPAVQETDWKGDTIARCDSYNRCPERVQAHARRMLAQGYPAWRAIESAEREMAGLEASGRLDEVRWLEAQGRAA